MAMYNWSPCILDMGIGDLVCNSYWRKGYFSPQTQDFSKVAKIGQVLYILLWKLPCSFHVPRLLSKSDLNLSETFGNEFFCFFVRCEYPSIVLGKSAFLYLASKISLGVLSLFGQPEDPLYDNVRHGYSQIVSYHILVFPCNCWILKI